MRNGIARPQERVGESRTVIATARNSIQRISSHHTQKIARCCGRGEGSAPLARWYEPSEKKGHDFRIVEESPGNGYMHVLTGAEIRERVLDFPEAEAKLAVVEMSRVTPKHRGNPCYGMQWGSAIYVYPVERNLIEHFTESPSVVNMQEIARYGGKWIQEGCTWNLVWTMRTIRDFYLHCVIPHELAHILDTENVNYEDREVFADLYALMNGYPASEAAKKRRTRKVRRRHHSK